MAEDTGFNIDNRLWRIEQQLKDLSTRIDKIDGILDGIEKRQEDRVSRMQTLDYKLSEIERRSSEAKAPSNPLNDSLLRQVIYGLLLGFLGLASGQALNFAGLLK